MVTGRLMWMGVFWEQIRQVHCKMTVVPQGWEAWESYHSRTICLTSQMLFLLLPFLRLAQSSIGTCYGFILEVPGKARRLPQGLSQIFLGLTLRSSTFGFMRKGHVSRMVLLSQFCSKNEDTCKMLSGRIKYMEYQLFLSGISKFKIWLYVVISYPFSNLKAYWWKHEAIL